MMCWPLCALTTLKCIKKRHHQAGVFSHPLLIFHSLGAHWYGLELQTKQDERIVESELTRERFLDLAVEVGSEVYLQPKNIRLFSNASGPVN